MPNNDHRDVFGMSEKEILSSSSSSQGTNSTPNTPPSPPVQPRTPPQLHEPPPVVVTPPPRKIRSLKPTAGKSPKTPSPSKSRLGAIDENSDAITPDIPDRNPLRYLSGTHKRFHLPNIPTLYGKRGPSPQNPPQNIYDDVEGPRGEKFSDVRKNKKTRSSSGMRKRFGWKLWCCAATLIIVVVLALVLGLVFGLRARNREIESNSSESPGLNGTFPSGRYSITTYLTTVNSSCTSNSATWRCAPYQTYTESPSGALSTLNWIIRVQDGTQYAITSDNSVFDYSFQNVPLTLRNNGTENEYWEFITTFDKTVLPSAVISNDGSQTRCLYNSTSLTGMLYTRKSKVPALQNSTATSNSGFSSVNPPWPYALSFSEAHGSGAGVPDCYKYINGQLGERVSVAAVSASAGVTRQCSCQYANFFT